MQVVLGDCLQPVWEGPRHCALREVAVVAARPCGARFWCCHRETAPVDEKVCHDPQSVSSSMDFEDGFDHGFADFEGLGLKIFRCI